MAAAQHARQLLSSAGVFDGTHIRVSILHLFLCFSAFAGQLHARLCNKKSAPDSTYRSNLSSLSDLWTCTRPARILKIVVVFQLDSDCQHTAKATKERPSQSPGLGTQEGAELSCCLAAAKKTTGVSIKRVEQTPT